MNLRKIYDVPISLEYMIYLLSLLACLCLLLEGDHLNVFISYSLLSLLRRCKMFTGFLPHQ